MTVDQGQHLSTPMHHPHAHPHAPRKGCPTTRTPHPEPHEGIGEHAPHGFAREIKTSSAESHRRAENTSFITRLMQGELDAQAYYRLLAQYLPIYTALECAAEEWRVLGNTELTPFLVEGLDRKEHITHDLNALGTHLGKIDTPLVEPATEAYAARITATKGNPARFLAHHYLRYLGDLSGGQAVASLVHRHYGIPHEALTMYRFPDIDKPKVFKDKYRVLLDDIEFTREQKNDLIDEVERGFTLNRSVFADLEKYV